MSVKQDTFTSHINQSTKDTIEPGSDQRNYQRYVSSQVVLSNSNTFTFSNHVMLPIFVREHQLASYNINGATSE